MSRTLARSMMVAAGCDPDRTRFSGVTTRVDGATPKGHIRLAPLTTWIGICLSLSMP